MEKLFSSLHSKEGSVKVAPAKGHQMNGEKRKDNRNRNPCPISGNFFFVSDFARIVRKSVQKKWCPSPGRCPSHQTHNF